MKILNSKGAKIDPWTPLSTFSHPLKELFILKMLCLGFPSQKKWLQRTINKTRAYTCQNNEYMKGIFQAFSQECIYENLGKVPRNKSLQLSYVITC